MDSALGDDFGGTAAAASQFLDDAAIKDSKNYWPSITRTTCECGTDITERAEYLTSIGLTCARCIKCQGEYDKSLKGVFKYKPQIEEEEEPAE